MEPLRSSQQLPHRSVSKNFQRSMYHYRPHVLLEKWAFPASENEHTMSDPGGNGNSSYYDASDGESSDYSNPIQENESPAAEASGVIADVLRSWKA
jgi:hypothetical protein